MVKERYRHGKTFPACTVIRQFHRRIPNQSYTGKQIAAILPVHPHASFLYWQDLYAVEKILREYCQIAPVQQTPVNEEENNEPHRCFADQVWTTIQALIKE